MDLGTNLLIMVLLLFIYSHDFWFQLDQKVLRWRALLLICHGSHAVTVMNLPSWMQTFVSDLLATRSTQYKGEPSDLVRRALSWSSLAVTEYS